MGTETNIPELPAFVYHELKLFAVGFLLDGRDWDLKHTNSVAFHTLQIARSEKLDIPVMFTAAMLHDVGYANMFSGTSNNLSEIMDKKEAHMVAGANRADEFLHRPDIIEFYGEEQRLRIVHLVGVHDKLQELKDLDELVLMEGDTLGAIDVSRTTPTFSYEHAKEYIEKKLLPKRYKRFVTPLGLGTFSSLFGKFISHYELKKVNADNNV